jgi:diaminopimelate decarboxylase
VFEPGRYIVGPAGMLLTRVLFMKEMGGKTFVITDAGMNDLLRPSHYASYHRVEPAVLTPGTGRRCRWTWSARSARAATSWLSTGPSRE